MKASIHHKPLDIHTVSPEQQVNMGLNPAQGTITTDHLEKSPDLTKPTVMDIQKMNKNVPLLYGLPTELRFMIFRDCIASGYPQFMKASRALQNDGQTLICKEGIYRMRFGAGDDNNGQRPTHDVARAIRNLDITIDLRRVIGLDQILNRSMPFAGSQILRAQCKVVLRVKCTMDVLVKLELIPLVSSFGSFEKVALWIEIDAMKDHSLYPCCCDAGWMLVLFESRLGKAELVKVKDGFCMIFYPRGHAEAAARRLEG